MEGLRIGNCPRVTVFTTCFSFQPPDHSLIYPLTMAFFFFLFLSFFFLGISLTELGRRFFESRKGGKVSICFTSLSRCVRQEELNSSLILKKSSKYTISCWGVLCFPSLLPYSQFRVFVSGTCEAKLSFVCCSLSSFLLLCVPNP